MAQFEIKDGVAIIPEGTKIIPAEVFKDCSLLTSVVIPDSVTEIEGVLSMVVLRWKALLFRMM